MEGHDLDIILTQVASCHLDILSNSKRHEVLQRVHDELFANKNEIGIIVDSFLCGVKKCHTRHSRVRFANLLLQVIIRFIHELNSSGHLKELWIAYSNLLVTIGLNAPPTNTTTTSNNNYNHRDILSTSFTKLDTIIDANYAKDKKVHEVVQSLYDCIWDIFTSETDNNAAKEGSWSIYISFLTHLSTYKNTLEDSTFQLKQESDLLDQFIDYVFKQKQFPSPQIMQLCHPFIQSFCTNESDTALTSVSMNTLLSTMALKLRASPESAFPTIHALLLQMNPTSSSSIQESFAANLLENAKLLQIIMKQITSTKEHLRQLASDVLTHLAKLDSCFAIIIESMVSVMSVGKSGTSSTALSGVKLASADHRAMVYTTLQNIATYLMMNSSLSSLSNCEDSLSILFETMTSTLTKESSTSSSRDVGVKSFVTWMICYKMSKRRETDNCDISSGYKKAIDFLLKPIVDAKNKSPSSNSSTGTNDFRSRIGSLFLCGNMMNDDAIKDIVLDLMTGKVESDAVVGLQSIIESSMKKHGNSAIVPQIDGLLATHLLLLYSSISAKNDVVTPQIRSMIIAAGLDSVSLESQSFLYSKAMTDASRTDAIAHVLLHKTIALASTLNKGKGLVSLRDDGIPSAAAFSLACCIASPNICLSDTLSENSSSSLVISAETILSYTDAKCKAADAISTALLYQINVLEKERSAASSKENGETIENDDKERKRQKFDINIKSVHDVSHILVKSVSDAEHFAQTLLLSHFETTAKTLGKKQRDGLEKFVSDALSRVGNDKFSTSAVADFIVAYLVGGGDYAQGGKLLTNGCDRMFKGTLSLIKTLGGIGGNFDVEFNDPEDPDSILYEVAWQLCVSELATKMSNQLSTTLTSIEALSKDDIGLYRSSPGILYVPPATESDDPSKITKRKKMSEDEEWEMKVKEEIAKKKAAETSGNTTTSISEEEKNMLLIQTKERKRMHHLIDLRFYRCLESIRFLSLSDVEIGNSILPIVSRNVTDAIMSKCEAFKALHSCTQLGFTTLLSLASCVYEIDEAYSLDVARSLCLSQKKVKNEVSFIALPSSCPSAVTTITEMDEYGDCLGLNSFQFLFPVIRSALTGPRSSKGCDSALRVLDRHSELLDNGVAVSNLRKEMASAVLELLSHDRAKTFADPTPVECLLNIYSSEEKLSPSEISPLLCSNGSIGAKSCRSACMIVLGSILSKHPRMIKINPLLENRIWVNCFSRDDAIREEARKAWNIGHGLEQDNMELPAPSKMFAVALTPLLGHGDDDISKSAADAYAHAIAKHPETAKKNLLHLFNQYVENYPTAAREETKEEDNEPKKAAPIVASKRPKPKLSVGTLKKTTKKKKTTGTAAISSLTTTKKKSTSKRKGNAPISLTSTSKKERTFDQNVLNAQFESNTEKEKKVEKDNDQKISVRQGILRVLTASTTCDMKLDESTLKLFVVFLLAYGLSDVNQNVRVSATNALRDVAASSWAKEAIDYLLPLLEASLKSGRADTSYLEGLPTEKVFETTAAGDNRKEGVVIALGAAAVHLNNQDDAAKIDETCDMLINTLSTPSANVQSSVALCLSKLMKKGQMQKRTEVLLSQLMNDCLNGKTLASRRGAAYGVSAVVKGSGIACLKKFKVVTRLEEACSMGSALEKEGALFAIELLSNRLGLLFEPYVIVLLPSLLQSFSDSSIHVRKAANSSVGLVMSKLSGHGVKLLMPAVLEGLENDDWRTKQASIHMLGSMSHCAPKQLASCLPRVVPKLTESFSDTHPKVKASAKEALEEISKVIRNPEISEISSILLNALIDPSQSTLTALESLIETEFLHAIDAASLSLIVPVLHRGLRDRAATTKRYAALIAGNICTMINEPKDFIPYLDMLLPDLKGVLLDPIPDCRSISAKALGSLTRSLGEATFPELRPWLIATLKGDEGTSVERSGAAQGLTEVICAGGARLVENVMTNDILPLIGHPAASYREGVLWVLTFLPSTLGQAFAPLIESAFPALISGLSDENEPVRDVAMRAGRVTIRSHGKAHVDKILPTLEEGLSDGDSRIRAASLNLLGDLLGCIGGSKISKNDGDTQDDIRQAERAQAQIALVLGPEIRKRVLSSLYLRRSDISAVVRQSAVQVWKSVVSVTPRTLKEILDNLVGQIVTALASGHPDHTQVAGRCLGDIVSKLGDTVFPKIIPVLRDALYRGDVHTRLGACVGLNEVIQCSSKEQIDKYLSIIVTAVQDALCDDLDNVREMAASCFQSLYSTVGNKAFDEVVPSLLVGMESNDEDDQIRTKSITGLTSILQIRSRELLPYLIPRLLKKPVTANQATALGSICKVTSNSINLFVPSIIPVYLSELVSIQDEESKVDDDKREESLRSCLSSLCSHIGGNGLNSLVSQIASKCGSDKEALRKESCWLLKEFIETRKDKNDYFEEVPTILRELLYRLNDNCESVLQATNSALSSLSKNVPAEELVEHIEFIRNLLGSMVSESRRRKGGVGDGEFLLPGFNRPKGLEPLLPIYQRGILYGSSSIREISAAGLGELVNITASKYLAGPFIIKLTGPLLRIVGDRNPSSVKIAIIQTLGLILTKGGPSLRAFVPQFQTTFSKALSDPSRLVRVEAIKALGLLMPLSTRVDPLLKELVSTSLGDGAISGLEAASVVVIQMTTLEALATVLKHGGKKAKLPDTIPSALTAGKECLYHNDDGIRIGAAKVIAAACELLPSETATDVAMEILHADVDSLERKHGVACYYRYILSSKVCPNLSIDIINDIKDRSIAFMKDDSDLVKEMACTASAILLGADPDTNGCIKQMEGSLLKVMKSKETMEVLKGIAKGLCIAAGLRPEIFRTKLGHPFLEAALENAMCGNQRIQLAYNDFLWLALDVKSGDDGITKYAGIAMFDKAKKMKSLYSKVLTKIKDVDIEY